MQGALQSGGGGACPKRFTAIARDDSAVTYRVGIKNKDTGALTYVSGTGTLGHRFLITESGAYAAYVENCSKTAMKVTGTAAFSQEHAAEPMDTGRKDTASAEMTSACGFRLTGKEEHGVGIQRQGILLGADNVLEMTVECPLLGEDEKKMALQIFIDYQQVPFAVDGNIYDTYYM